MSDAKIRKVINAAEVRLTNITGKKVAITYCFVDNKHLKQDEENEILNPYDFALLCCAAMGLSTYELKNERFALLSAVVAIRSKYKEVATWQVIKEALKLVNNADAINAHIEGLTSQRKAHPKFSFYYNKLKPLIK